MKENSIEDRIEEKYTRYINCETDILELTIEEAIFILETDEKVHYVEDLLQEVYKVILSDYKRVLKENEILKEEKEQAWEEWNNLEQGSYETEQKIKQQIKKLQKENEELKESYMCAQACANMVFDKIIPVQKVKDKIEELNKKEKKELKGMKGQDRYFVKQTYQNKRMIMQELIKESEE